MMTLPLKTAMASDEERAIAVMTRAFNSDRAFRWMYPEPHQYLTNFPHFDLGIRW